MPDTVRWGSTAAAVVMATKPGQTHTQALLGGEGEGIERTFGVQHGEFGHWARRILLLFAAMDRTKEREGQRARAGQQERERERERETRAK